MENIVPIQAAGVLLSHVVESLQDLTERGRAEGPNPLISFSRGHSPGVIPAEGTLNHIATTLHGLLRCKAATTHKRITAPDNAFIAQLSTRPLSTSLFQKSAEALDATTIPPSVQNDITCASAYAALREQLSKFSAQSRPPSLRDGMEVLKSYRKFYHAWNRIDPSSQSVISTFDNTCHALCTQIREELEHLDRVDLTLTHPETKDSFTVSIINKQPSSSCALMLMNLQAGQAMLDTTKVPESIQKLYEHTGETSNITANWQTISNRILDTLRSSGYSDKEATSLLAANGYVLSRQETTIINRAIAAYLPQLQFECALESTANHQPTIYNKLSNTLYFHLGQIPPPTPPIPIAENHAQLETIAAELYRVCVEACTEDEPTIRKALEPLAEAFPKITNQDSIRNAQYIKRTPTRDLSSQRTRTAISNGLASISLPSNSDNIDVIKGLRTALLTSLDNPHCYRAAPSMQMR